MLFDSIVGRRRQNSAAWSLVGGVGSILGAAAMLFGPAHASAQQWQVDPRVSERITYSDNANLSGKGEEENDVIFRTAAGISIIGMTRRFLVDFDYEASYSEFVDDSRLDGFRQRLTGVGLAELVDDTFFLDVRAAISERTLDRRTPAPATDRPALENRTEVFNYSISPSLTFDVTDFAVFDALYRFAEVRFSDPDVGRADRPIRDSTINEAHGGLRSDVRSSRFEWSITGDYIDTDQGFLQRGGRFSLGYAIFRGFTPIARVGYEDIDTPTLGARDVTGLVWAAGFRYEPGPRTLIQFEAGERFEDDSFLGQVTHEFSETLRFAASYTDSVTSQQLSLSNRLSVIGSADFPDLRTLGGTPIDPNGSETDLVDDVFRERRGTLRLFGESGRTSYNIIGFYSQRDFFTVGTEEEVIGASLGLARELSRELSANVNVSYSETLEARQTGFGDKTWRASAGFTYRFVPGISASAEYVYRRLQRDIDPNVQENAVTIQVQAVF